MVKRGGMLRLAAVVAAAAFVFGACGDDDKPETTAAGDGTTTTSTGPGGSSGTTVPGGTATTVTTAGGGAGGPAPTTGAGGPGTTTAGGQQTIPVDATLAVACLRPGSVQTLTVSTRPNAALGYDTQYPDGKTGMHRDSYGGNGAGKADESGKYTGTWPVASNAPPGTAIVRLTVAGEGYAPTVKELPYKIANASGQCP